jgi:DNA-binding NtrC family response regulator
VLETRTFRRVGGTQDIDVDVRVIALTNKDLAAAVRRGEFRQDLYYRLKVIAVKMPSLRERTEDIAPLAEHFLERFAEEFKKPRKQLAPQAQQAFQRYSWPGNARELRNAIERLVILEADPVIALDHLPLEIRAGVPSDEPSVITLPAEGITLETVERDLVRQALERTGGNRTRAAELLGIERDALRRRLIKFGFHETGGDGV